MHPTVQLASYYQRIQHRNMPASVQSQSLSQKVTISAQIYILKYYDSLSQLLVRSVQYPRNSEFYGMLDPQKCT